MFGGDFDESYLNFFGSLFGSDGPSDMDFMGSFADFMKKREMFGGDSDESYLNFFGSLFGSDFDENDFSKRGGSEGRGPRGSRHGGSEGSGMRRHRRGRFGSCSDDNLVEEILGYLFGSDFDLNSFEEFFGSDFDLNSAEELLGNIFGSDFDLNSAEELLGNIFGSDFDENIAEELLGSD